MGGTRTPEYIAFRKNFSKLTEGILQAVPQVAAKAFDHSLITSQNLTDAKNESKGKYDRASDLLQILLSKIQSDEKFLGTILNILSSMPELDHLKELLLDSKSVASDLSSTAHGQSNTIQVNIVQGCFYSLLVGIEKVLPQFAIKSFEKELISEDNLRDATNSVQPEYDRSKVILETIKEKIESNPNCYDVFLSVLHEVPKLKDLVSVMEDIIKQENSSRLISSSIPGRLYARSRRLSNSDISNSDILKCENLPEVLEPDSGIPCHDYDDMLTNCPEDDMSSLNVSEQHTSIPVDGLNGVTELPPSKIGLEGVNKLPVQTSLNGVTDPPMRAHSEMVVSNSAPTSHITDTEERITRLEQEFNNCNEKLRQQGEHINNLMEEIGKLKDVIAEKEELIADLRVRNEETERKLTEKDETIKNLKESHRLEVQKLEHQLLQKELEKEKELNQLRKDAFEQEKIISDLKKEKELDAANREKELALKDAMLLSTQKELAEERESRAKDEAKHEKEKRKSSETREKLAQEELRKMREKYEQLLLENKQTS